MRSLLPPQKLGRQLKGFIQQGAPVLVPTEKIVQDRIGRLLSSAPAVIYSYKATGDFAPTFISQNIRKWLGYGFEPDRG